MDHRNPCKGRAPHRTLALACAAALALSFATARPSQARRVTPPVPAGLEVEAGSKAFLVGHAVGTQDYVCLPSSTSVTGFAWTLFTPQATLFDRHGKQLTTHFFSPSPFEGGAFRPTWQHSRDTGSVWVKLNASSADSAYVAPGAIPWLLLDVTGTLAGPRGGDALGATTQIHRVNTSGGAAPATGCSAAEHVGAKAIVPYTADYVFYSNDDADGD